MATTDAGEGRRRALPDWLPAAGRIVATVAVTILGLLIITFLIGRVVPVDPVIAVGGDKLTAAAYQKIYTELGLDKPLWEQFFIYIGNVFRGDLGTSFLTKRPITTDIATFFPATFELATVGTLIGTVIGVPLGVWAAVRQGRIADQIVRVIGLIGYSAPIFWLGMLGLLLFYAKLHWVAGSGRIDYLVELDLNKRTGLLLIDTLMQGNWTAFRDVVAHLALPAMLLGYFSMAYISRMTRSFMLNELAQEYVVTARVKGVPEGRIIFGHALRNAAVPLVTVIALSYAGLLEGSVLTETVFDWPGIGKYLTNSLQKADMNAVLGCTLLIGTIFIGINLLSDLLYRLLDPRVRRRA